MSFAGIISRISSYIHLSVRYMSNVKDIFDLKTEVNYLLSRNNPTKISGFSFTGKSKHRFAGQRSTGFVGLYKKSPRNG